MGFGEGVGEKFFGEAAGELLVSCDEQGAEVGDVLNFSPVGDDYLDDPEWLIELEAINSTAR